jgi:hypothetical protein
MRRQGKKFVRWLTTAALLLGGAVVGPVAMASPASAGSYGCNGNLVYSQDVYGVDDYADTVVAHVYGYWDGTTNCEVAVKRIYVGTPTHMEIWLWSENGQDHDSGSFSQYAGPVRVNGVGSCIWEEVDMNDPSGRNIAQAYNYDHHNCG